MLVSPHLQAIEHAHVDETQPEAEMIDLLQAKVVLGRVNQLGGAVLALRLPFRYRGR